MVKHLKVMGTIMMQNDKKMIISVFVNGNNTTIETENRIIDFFSENTIKIGEKIIKFPDNIDKIRLELWSDN